MAHYIIEGSHNDTECIESLRTIVDWGLHVLHHTWFGCAVGVHTAWLQLEADTEAEARGVLPPQMRRAARVVEVEKLTPERLKTLH